MDHSFLPKLATYHHQTNLVRCTLFYFPSRGSKMVQRESFDVSPATYRFTIYSKTPDSSSIEASPGTHHIFVITHEDHLHPPCTGKLSLTSAHKIDPVSLSCSLKYLTLHEEQVANLHVFHNDISITLSAAAKTNIEVIP